MNKKGFTLTELLGVITVVAILCLITFPSVISQIRGKEKVLDEATKTLIESGVEIYMNYHETEYPKTVGQTYCITLQKLVDDNLLEEPIQNAKGERIDLETPVLVTVKSTSALLMEYNSNTCRN